MEVEDVQSIMFGILLGSTAMPSLEIDSTKISLSSQNLSLEKFSIELRVSKLLKNNVHILSMILLIL